MMGFPKNLPGEYDPMKDHNRYREDLRAIAVPIASCTAASDMTPAAIAEHAYQIAEYMLTVEQRIIAERFPSQS